MKTSEMERIPYFAIKYSKLFKIKSTYTVQESELYNKRIYAVQRKNT